MRCMLHRPRDDGRCLKDGPCLGKETLILKQGTESKVAVCQRGECTSGAFEKKTLRRYGDAKICEDPIVGAISGRDPVERNSATSRRIAD